MDYHKIIGIDLGTTFSVVATWNNETGKAEAFDLPGHQPPTCIFPSVVSVSRQGKILVGWQAKRNLAANPQNTIVEVKRLMGDPQELDLGGRKFSPQMISAMVLQNLKTIAEARIGSPIHDAVITVPAYFKDVQRQATSDAARLAGLNPRLLINEPTAAAIAYGLDNPSEEERIYIVYDLGGGTFDVSVILARGNNIEVMGTAGDDHLGGGDFDNAITQWVFDQIVGEWPGAGALAQRKDLWARVKVAAEQAKIELSASDTAVIEVPNLTPEINVYYEIDRDTFIKLLNVPQPRRPGQPPVGLLDETVQSVEEAVASAKRGFAERYGREDFDFKDVTAFLMVGGSTRIPKVREMLTERFQRPVLFDPAIVDKAVAVGAAIRAREMRPMDKFEGEVVAVPDRVDSMGRAAAALPPQVELGVVDVTGHSLGVAVEGGRFHRLISKDTPVPASKTQTGFTTAFDNQPAVKVQVYQGEDPLVMNNTPLGELSFDNLPPAPVKFHIFDVTFKLDVSGLLTTTVKHSVRDNSRPPEVQSVNLQSSGISRITKEQLLKNRRELEEILRGGGLDPAAHAQADQVSWGAEATPSAAQAQAWAADTESGWRRSGSPTPAYTPPQTVAAAPVPSDRADSEQAIPPDYRDVWKRSVAQVGALTGARKHILSSAIRHFEQAVQSGNVADIEKFGNAMVDTYFGSI